MDFLSSARKRPRTSTLPLDSFDDLRGTPHLNQAILSTRALFKSRLSPGYIPPTTSPPLGLHTQHTHIHALLSKALDKKMHEPFLLVGSRGTGKSLCLEHVLETLRQKHAHTHTHTARHRPFRVIYVNGKLENSDVGAIAEIAAQLEMGKGLDTSKKRSGGGSAAGGGGGGRGRRKGAREQLDFIVEGMRSGTFEETPLVFVIDHVEGFVGKGGVGGGGGGNGKQLLLYSLMDLQHRSDLQFVVVGVSNELDVLDRFEKRIRSRISNKQIFFPSAQPLDTVIMAILDQAFHIPPQPPTPNSTDTKTNTHTQIHTRYATAFNAEWSLLRPQIQDLLSWPQKLGRPLRWFSTLAYRAITNLDTDTPFLTKAHFVEALQAQGHTLTAGVKASFASLANLELLVIIAMKRLVDRGRERCTLEMIWAEYEQFLKQEPLLPCRYSRAVFHKGLLNVLALGLVSVCHRIPPGGQSYLTYLPPVEKDFVSFDSAELGTAPLCVMFYPQDLQDFLVGNEQALPTLVTRWGSSWTE